MRDLHDACGEALARVIETCGPSRHRTLLRVLATAEARVWSDSPFVDEPGSEAQAELYAALIEWGTGWRVTDADATRNRWLLEHAIEVLRGRPWLGLSVAPGRPSQPAREFRRRKHDRTPEGSSLGPLARDFVWLVRYALLPPREERQCRRRDLDEWAPGASHDLIIRRVRSAADRAGFDLPDPLRPASSDE